MNGTPVTSGLPRTAASPIVASTGATVVPGWCFPFGRRSSGAGRMNWALWKKAISAAWLQLVVCGVLLVLFGWLFVWLTGLFKLGVWGSFLKMLPGFTKRLMNVPLAQLATPVGQISVLYVHGIPILICLGWAIGRGSDAISGEISRGTMDLTLTLPVRRTSVLVVPAIVAAVVGAVVLAAALWVGNWLGLALTRGDEEIAIGRFLPGAVNLAAMMFAMNGITAFISSWNRDRWRTISIAAAVYVVSFLLTLVARLWEPGAWLRFGSFLTAFDPQRLILVSEETWSLLLWYNGTLVALGLIAYVAAAVVFSRRDIPAAL